MNLSSFTVGRVNVPYRVDRRRQRPGVGTSALVHVVISTGGRPPGYEELERALPPSDLPSDYKVCGPGEAPCGGEAPFGGEAPCGGPGEPPPPQSACPPLPLPSLGGLGLTVPGLSAKVRGALRGLRRPRPPRSALIKPDPPRGGGELDDEDFEAHWKRLNLLRSVPMLTALTGEEAVVALCFCDARDAAAVAYQWPEAGVVSMSLEDVAVHARAYLKLSLMVVMPGAPGDSLDAGEGRDVEFL